MPRTALIVAYNGAGYHGWQKQEAQIQTVQDELARAVSAVADAPVNIYCAGRTDTGVHATKQVVHFDAPVERPSRAWVMGVNTHMSEAVSVNWAGAVSSDFDARRSAVSRQYLYLIHNHRVRSALMSQYLTRERRDLDADLMHRSAQALLGEHDFSSFRASHCQSLSPRRLLSDISVRRYGDIVAMSVRANAFLHHMVRNIAGVLMDVGAGEKAIDWPIQLLALKDRTQAGITAPPNGLYLIDVEYPENAGIPGGAVLPHFFQGFEV